MGQHLLSAYSVHIVGLGDGSAEAYNEQDLLPASVLWGRQISVEIIQKGKKGARQVMSVRAENACSQQKFLILSISVTVHVAFISFAKGRRKIL